MLRNLGCNITRVQDRDPKRTSSGTDHVHVRTSLGATIWSTSAAEVLSPEASRLTGYVSRLSRCTTTVSPACAEQMQ